jgi:hypothetical protein
MKWEGSKKDLKKKIKRIETKFDIKIHEKQMLRDEIENKIQLRKKIKINSN